MKYHQIEKHKTTDITDFIQSKKGIFLIIKKTAVYEFDSLESREQFLRFNPEQQKSKQGILSKSLQWFLGLFIGN